MDLERLRELDQPELTLALDELGIERGWEIGDRIRALSESLLPPDGPCLPGPATSRRQGFQNQVVGRIAERVFRDDHLTILEADGFEIEDLHEKGENRDYVAHKDRLELPINVKVASTRFERAQTIVKLDPDDCIPIGAYKAIGASERVPDLVYVDLVDFTLRDKVDDFMDELDGSLGIGWHLLSWYGGKGAKAAEDRYVDTLFEQHAAALKSLAPDVISFHVISALRVLAILRKTPRRVPGLGIRAAGRGGINGEVNVHVSVKAETRPWIDVAEQLKRDGVGPILDAIRRTARVQVPDPLL
jgi:hypothetical protein